MAYLTKRVKISLAVDYWCSCILRVLFETEVVVYQDSRCIENEAGKILILAPMLASLAFIVISDQLLFPSLLPYSRIIEFLFAFHLKIKKHMQ